VEGTTGGYETTPEQRRVAEHADGPLLVVGPAGSGRSEALAGRAAALASRGTPIDRILVFTSSRAGAGGLRGRIEALVDPAHEELAVDTYAGIAELLLLEHALEAGIDPFVVRVSAADRLAILLDRLDELPLRRHEIRGNPAGLLARLLGRIDALKGEAIGPGRLRQWAEEQARAAGDPPAREAAGRELEFAELYAAHDRILRERGGIDGGDLVIELSRLLRENADVRSAIAERFPFVLVDELEDTGAAHRDLISVLAVDDNVTAACDPAQGVRAFRGAGSVAADDFRRRYPACETIELARPVRFGAGIAAAADAILGRAADASAADSDGVRLWRCEGERAQAQAAARDVERLIASGEVRPERIGLIAGGGWREARLIAAAFEERGVPFRFLGDGALFQRPEVRDALAWLRLLADSNDSAAVVRAVTRPPVELRSGDLARCTTIARRRKLDMVSALEAALESPQIGPEARDRIHAFLRLRAGAAAAMEQMRPDAFVRRLVERIGVRRHRLFAATPETAERLQSLARLAERAADWSRREPSGSVREFIRELAAVADAGDLDAGDPNPPPPGAAVIAEADQIKGMDLDHVYVLGLGRSGLEPQGWRERWVPDELLEDERPAPGPELAAARRAQLAYVAATRAHRSLVLAWPEAPGGQGGPGPEYEAVAAALGIAEEVHVEELFGPAEGLHSTYRMLRDEVLEASWKAGSALSEMRLDTAEDVNAAVARFLELLKLAALIQRPGEEGVGEALAALNELIRRIATDEQRAVLDRSSLDEYVVGEETATGARRELVGSASEPGLERFIPHRGEGLALSASDIDLYRTCPLKYKFARVFAIPQEPTINQRFGILIHQVLQRFHSEELRRPGAGEGLDPPGSLDRLLALFESGWRRTGFGSSDDELQYRDRAVAALARYHEHHTTAEARPVWLERSFAFAIGPHQLRGRVDRVDRLPDGGYEVIDYKTGGAKAAAELSDDVQIPLYRLGARAAWELELAGGAYWYVLDDERVSVPSAPDDAERVERTVLEVAGGIEGQDFEPRPSYEICSWCDYRLICPASEA
jgi:superfamily I DNA/RNA helicase/RecB family exonuclease